MQTDFHEELGTLLPEEQPYPYFAEREGAWLLRRQMAGPTRISELRNGPMRPFLARPGVPEVLATCGDGWLHPDSLSPLADPLDAFAREHEFAGDRGAEAAFDVACTAPWTEYRVSFGVWPGNDQEDWREMQLSRKGRNLVVQLNMPSTYTDRFQMLVPPEVRDCLERYGHPVCREGMITLAWARLDFDRKGEDLLIEEVQSDWVRDIKDCLKLGALWPNRKLTPPERVFFAEALETHGRTWARAMMLAVLAFAARDLGIRRVWMHQRDLGARLKNIDTKLPPRSLYTDLPKRFGFRLSPRAPKFLYEARSRVLAKWRRSGRPLFWMLDVAAGSEG